MDIHSVDIEDVGSFVQACEKGDLEYVRKYVEKGGNVEARDYRRSTAYRRLTALMLASGNGRGNVVEFLLSKGANVNARGKNGITTLIYVSEQGEHKKITELLLNRGANIEAQDDDGWTALMCASYYGRKDTVELLLDRGANIEAQDYSGETALMNASRGGCKDVITLLLDRGANIGVRENTGWNALMYVRPRELAEIFLRRDVPYPDVPMSSFIPLHEDTFAPSYNEIAEFFVPLYMERVVKDPGFERDMQQDLEEILAGKTDEHRDFLTDEGETLLKKLLKTLRSIDYTERVSQGRNEEIFQAFDMEL